MAEVRHLLLLSLPGMRSDGHRHTALVLLPVPQVRTRPCIFPTCRLLLAQGQLSVSCGVLGNKGKTAELWASLGSSLL